MAEFFVEFFKWLSSNPIATNILLFAFILLVVVFILAVVITVVAFIRKETISMGGLRFGPELGARIVQIGEVNIPDPKRSDFYDGTYQGSRTILVPVIFDPPFKKDPRVVVSLKKIDLGDFEKPKINRLVVRAENIRPKGFNLCFETWADSKVYDGAASWIAVGE